MKKVNFCELWCRQQWRNRHRC